MPNTIDQLDFGVTLERYPGTLPADSLGDLNSFKVPMRQLYDRMPFPALHDDLTLRAFHMDCEEQDLFVEQKRSCLKDIYPDQAGYQGGAGLYLQKVIDLAFRPNNYTPDYEGPSRALTEQNRIDGRGVLSHEFGHYYFDASRYEYNNDDISKRLTAAFNAIRPYQAQNNYEDAAEVYRAICGDNTVIGTFSDKKPFAPSPELKSLVRCLYFLAANYKGCWVSNVTPKSDGVMFCVFVGLGWEWRYVMEANWSQYKWNGSTWIQ